MIEQMDIFQREGQRISASDILQQIASCNEIRLENCTVSGDLDISRLLVKEEGFDLNGLTVIEVDNFSEIRINVPIRFRSCVFEGDVSFAPPWDNASMLKVVFCKDVVFNSSEFGGQARFSGVEFRSLASFDGCVFKRVTGFRQSKFMGRAYFRTVEFCGYGLFNDSVFEEEVRFTNTCFTRGGNFTNVRFESVTDFSGVYARSKSVPVYESVHFAIRGGDESFWRFIKQSAQEAGHYQLAGESFYNERCGHFWRQFKGPNYRELSNGKKLLRILTGARLLPEFIFGRMLFGYGERPIRVLFASAAVVLMCATFYASPYAELACRFNEQMVTSEKGFLDGLYFSTITFTTLGFGDIYPNQQHLLTRCVAMSEALCGASLMALFVVTLSKRYSRG